MSESEAPNPYQAPAAIDDAELPAGMIHAELMTTAVGLRLTCFGMSALLMAFILLVGSRFVGFALPGLFAAVMGGVGLLLTGIGPLLCLAVPARTGLRRWIIAAIACPCVMVIGGTITRALGVSIPFELVLALGWLLGIAFFLVFLSQLANYIGRFDLAQRGEITLAIGILVVTVVIALGLVSGVSSGIAAIVALVLILVTVVLFLSYVSLMRGLAKAIRSPRGDDEFIATA